MPVFARRRSTLSTTRVCPSVSTIPSTLSSPDMRCLIFAVDFRCRFPARLCRTCVHLRITIHRPPFFPVTLSLSFPALTSHPAPSSRLTPARLSLSRHNWHSFSLAATSCVTFLLALCINFSSLPRALISIERSILCHVPSVHSLGRHPCSILYGG